MRYFANININGAVKYRDVPGSIGILEAPDNFMSIGMASQAGYVAGGFKPGS
jgi:hypothetical protein